MTTVYVTFDVDLCDTEYSYHSTANAKAEMKIEIELDTLKGLEANAVFASLLKTAIVKFEKALAEKPDAEKPA